MAENFYQVHRAFGHTTEDGRTLYFTQANGHEIDEALEAGDLPQEKVDKLIDLGHLTDGRIDPADLRDRRIEHAKAVTAKQADKAKEAEAAKTERAARKTARAATKAGGVKPSVKEGNG